ncbi:uncharacterized protein ARMOST_09465 [Armillaria ostoyae]|uniref:Uncharacterized protein n=3 Tax=Armillaria TaxID=47424 RepID=A0A284RBL8_ARMOS|nr:hypothetical protein EDD85DRAFT_944609 [Armillaria nabsnona]PBK76857.1 hypothetical protein ARMSODRAFT_948705 [Armillaria solidipes]PBL00636.1 hypothetical protein ARMGADRAFT_1072979 [Armillaria gallica]SJL06129.1 uncharacterized protein ARMOST_09465 [Armillaria ostoyae]
MAKKASKPKSKPAAVQGSRTLLQSYLNLPANTRLRLSLGFVAFAGVGLLVSDWLEARIPPPPRASQQ